MRRDPSFLYFKTCSAMSGSDTQTNNKFIKTLQTAIFIKTKRARQDDEDVGEEPHDVPPPPPQRCAVRSGDHHGLDYSDLPGVTAGSHH